MRPTANLVDYNIVAQQSTIKNMLKGAQKSVNGKLPNLHLQSKSVCGFRIVEHSEYQRQFSSFHCMMLYNE